MVKTYPQIQKEKRDEELKKQEEVITEIVNCIILLVVCVNQQRISGNTVSATSKNGKQRRRAAKGKGRWKDNIKALDPPVGRFKNGVLSLSEKEVKKISKSSL